MLEIRQAQLQAFREHAVKSFRRRLSKRLAEVTELSDTEIEANIEFGIRMASEYRLKREADIARFIETVCVYLGGFPATGLPRPALPLLYAYGVDPARKLDNFALWCGAQRG
jgi:hypothetical protein